MSIICIDITKNVWSLLIDITRRKLHFTFESKDILNEVNLEGHNGTNKFDR